MDLPGIGLFRLRPDGVGGQPSDVSGSPPLSDEIHNSIWGPGRNRNGIQREFMEQVIANMSNPSANFPSFSEAFSSDPVNAQMTTLTRAILPCMEAFKFRVPEEPIDWELINSLSTKELCGLAIRNESLKKIPPKALVESINNLIHENWDALSGEHGLVLGNIKFFADWRCGGITPAVLGPHATEKYHDEWCFLKIKEDEYELVRVDQLVEKIQDRTFRPENIQEDIIYRKALLNLLVSKEKSRTYIFIQEKMVEKAARK